MTKIIGKCTAATAAAVNSVKNGASNAKQEGVIAGLEAQIDRYTSEIGRLTVLSLDKGGDISDAVRERYDAILGLRAEMKDAEKAKKYDRIVCPHCGAKTSSGMKYCSCCGEPLESEEESA